MEIRKRIIEIENLLKNIDFPHGNASNNERLKSFELSEGISFIIPIYNGNKYFKRLVDSLKEIVSHQYYFEFIFIFNGDLKIVEKEMEILTEKLVEFQLIKYCRLLKSKKGAAVARNKGIENANYEYIVFLDCDDELSENFIDNVFPMLNKNCITLFDLHELKDGANDHGNNVIQKETIKFQNKCTQDYLKISKSLSMNGAKVIPTQFLKNILFNETLKSGEDVVLMMHIIVLYSPTIYILPKGTGIYLRHLEENSLSRKRISYEFNVTERMAVIKILSDLLSTIDDTNIRQLIINRMDAQAGFINRYLIEHPQDYISVIELLKNIKSEYLPFSKINEKLAKTLFIGYCFSPYADTSGIVLAKRINQFQESCDVISNKMDTIRNMDYSLSQISEPYIRKHIELNCKPSFSNYGLMMDFVNKGFKKINCNDYDKIYSRVLWPASHLLAYKIKNKNSNIFWSAEFSDPILFDIHNHERFSPVSKYFLFKLKKQVPEMWLKYLNHNLYNLIEIIAFVFADELIFTNANQQKLMIDRFDDKAKKIILSKSKILPHPTLTNEFYNIEDSLLQIDDKYFNIAYFGNFYDTRSADDLLKVLSIQPFFSDLNKSNKPLKLNIFTNNAAQVRLTLQSKHQFNSINVYSFVPYFEFLNLTTRMDALLISDAHTNGIKEENPYLPSKLSDYLGSQKPIIAFVEKNSPLDQLDNNQIIKIPLNNKNV